MGLISFIFRNILKIKIENDEGIISSIKDGDKLLDETSKCIVEQERDGNKVPDY